MIDLIDSTSCCIALCSVSKFFICWSNIFSFLLILAIWALYSASAAASSDLSYCSKIFVADDIETSENCNTQTERDKVKAAVTEFRQIVQPLRGSILYLGTPHTELSIYNELYNKGHQVRIFPIKYPTQQQQEKYGDKLAPAIIQRLAEKPELVGMPTDPLRFNEDDILKLESEGRSKFAMQQMLDTTLSDLERYPLKCSDLIVMDCDKEIAPEKVAYGSAPNQVIKDLPCNGIGTDKFYSPIPLADIKWLPYSYKVMALDPSGRG